MNIDQELEEIRSDDQININIEEESKELLNDQEKDLNNSNKIKNKNRQHQHQHQPSISSKAHAFNGAVLAPKHARELTPNLVLTISIALAESCIPMNSNHNHVSSNRVRCNTAGTIGSGSSQHNQQFRRTASNPTVIMSSSLSGDILLKQEQAVEDETQKILRNSRIGVVQYTVWITEAWRILNWAEPSAALFWEMATMYHTLFVASRSIGDEIRSTTTAANINTSTTNNSDSHIPPILSCGSTSSHGSTPAPTTVINTPTSPNNATTSTSTSTSTSTTTSTTDKKKKHATHVAKELPVWLLSMFLLMHCESQAYARSVSGEDERRFDMTLLNRNDITNTQNNNSTANPLDVTTLLMHPSLSPRTRIHAGHHTSNVHCCSFLLRHLRKFILFASLPDNTDILHRLALLTAPASTSTPASTATSKHNNKPSLSPKNNNNANNNSINTNQSCSSSINANDINSKHELDHGTIGTNILLSSEQLERLTFLFHTAPQGGLIDEPPLKMIDFFSSKHNNAHSNANDKHRDALLLIDVENILRYELEKELYTYIPLQGQGLGHSRLTSNPDQYDNFDDDDGDGGGYEFDDFYDDDEEHISQRLSDLSIKDKESEEKHEKDNEVSSTSMSSRSYSKELTYKNLSGTTILLKPYLEERELNSSNNNNNHNITSSSSNPMLSGRLHDVTIVDCSDAHMYLLQPFEHATISGCTGCTIVVGAVAGLLNVVDCERTTISSAARRILVWNSFDVLNCCFTPSPPLLVGDVRSCQFAPYNTYYDGLREDLLSTGLAAAVLDQNLSTANAVGPPPPSTPTTPNTNTQSNTTSSSSSTTIDANDMLDASPALQCASNKWKLPVELSKLEIPQVVPNSLSFDGTTGNNTMTPTERESSTSNSNVTDELLTPILLPASAFHILFIPYESKSAKFRKVLYQQKQQQENNNTSNNNEEQKMTTQQQSYFLEESQYCRNLESILQLCPFRLPIEYERRIFVKVERMRSLQTALQTDLSVDQQALVEDELNLDFREWLVSSGNLRQVLDLVHLERTTNAAKNVGTTSNATATATSTPTC